MSGLSGGATGVHRGFAPDDARGRAVDAAVHADLAESLAHIATACEAAGRADLAGALTGCRTILARGGRLPSAAFGLYFDLGDALLIGDDAAASRAAAGLASLSERPRAVTLRERGRAGMLDSLLDLRMGEEAALFHPVAPGTADAFAPRLAAGFDLLDRGAPELAGEIRAILSDVVLAEAPPQAQMEFDGASHYQFWGLLLLNPNHHQSPLAMAEVLAHEAGHSLLFGLMRDETLVRNPDDQLFPSPLRADPRPMDGIYHATWVSARMAWVMERLAASGILSEEETAQARTEAAKDRRNFASGMAVIAAHGDLTDTGRALLQGAAEAMDHDWGS